MRRPSTDRPRRITALLLGTALSLTIACGPVLTAPAAAQPPTTPAAAQPPTTETAAPAVAKTTDAVAAVPPAVETPPRPAGVGREHLPRELSPWGMFMAADVVVKGVMVFLALASVLVWTAWIAKHLHLMRARAVLRRRLGLLVEAASLDTAAGQLEGARDAAAEMVRASVAEIARSDGGALPAGGIKERIASHLTRIEASAGRAMGAGTGLLATVGGTAPFIGLFGTVWGIMNSFIGISKAQTTNLAVVAPGIAEALLATAIGLVAAIPAVMFYNQLARAISGYKSGLADASAAVERLASRDLDRIRAPSRGLRAAE